MLIQKIIFPREEICNEWKMYFQSKIPGNWGGAIDDRNDDLYVIQRMKNNGRKAGNVIESSRSNSIVKTKLGQVKGETPFPKEKQLKHFREAEGYSFEESIENLEYSLYKPVKKKKKTSNN